MTGEEAEAARDRYLDRAHAAVAIVSPLARGGCAAQRAAASRNAMSARCISRSIFG